MSLAAAERQRERLSAYQVKREPIDPVALFRCAWNDEPDEWQRQVLTSDSKRLLLCTGRQSGKSTVTATLAVQELLSLDNALVLLLSPSLRQSGELFNKCQHVYHAWNDTAERKQPARYETKLTLALENGARLVSLPGKPATIRGFSAVTTLIIDEAAFAADILYRSVRPMLAVSNGRIALLSTPFGKRGFYWEEWSSEHRDEYWEAWEVKSTDNPRIPADFLEEERRTNPLFEQEYMCKFLDSENGLFDLAMVQQAIEEGRIEESWF